MKKKPVILLPSLNDTCKSRVLEEVQRAMFQNSSVPLDDILEEFENYEGNPIELAKKYVIVEEINERFLPLYSKSILETALERYVFAACRIDFDDYIFENANVSDEVEANNAFKTGDKKKMKEAALKYIDTLEELVEDEFFCGDANLRRNCKKYFERIRKSSIKKIELF